MLNLNDLLYLLEELQPGWDEIEEFAIALRNLFLLDEEAEQELCDQCYYV